MSGRPNRCFWVLTLLLYGAHPWLQRRAGGWVRILPPAACYATGIRVSRLRAALLRLHSLGLITEFRPYQGCWDVRVGVPLTQGTPQDAGKAPQIDVGALTIAMEPADG